MNFYQHIVVQGESLTDIAMFEYGFVGGVFFLVQDNPDIADISTNPVAGTIVNIRFTADVPDVRLLDYVRQGRTLQLIQYIPGLTLAELIAQATALTIYDDLTSDQKDALLTLLENNENMKSSTPVRLFNDGTPGTIGITGITIIDQKSTLKGWNIDNTDPDNDCYLKLYDKIPDEGEPTEVDEPVISIRIPANDTVVLFIPGLDFINGISGRVTRGGLILTLFQPQLIQLQSNYITI